MNRDDLQAMAQREQDKQQKFRCRLLCCASTPCLSSGASAGHLQRGHRSQRVEGGGQYGLDRLHGTL